LKLRNIIILSILVSCSSKENIPTNKSSKENENPIICTNNLCEGKYIGKEFINGSDTAHQFSNKMSKIVGDKLKELYDRKLYSIVDFSKIEMSTKGMGSGNVEYYLKIPFKRVKSKCESFTSFDHVGGWNHKPELNNRKKQLQSALLLNERLHISELKKTKEGLQEYWIQGKNKDKQKECLN